MPSKNYQRGYSLEYKVKQMLEEHGYLVTRCPASKSAADLIAFNKTEKILVQCKNTSKESMYVYGLKPLMELADKYGAKPLLVYSLYYTPPYVVEVKEDSFKAMREGDHVKLVDYFSKGV